MRLLRAESTRLFARRFTRIGLVGLVLLLAVIAFAIAASTRQPTPADMVAAKISAEQNRDQLNAEYTRCRDQQEQSGTSGVSPSTGPEPGQPGDKPYPPGFDCHQIVAHLPTEQDFLPASFNLARTGPDLFRALGAMLALFGFAVGASFIGADWSSGGVITLLLWRPRRIAVWLGKLASLLLGVLGVSAVFSALWYATLWVLASRGGSTAMTGGELRSLGLTDLRAVVLALAAATIGYAVSSLGRNTATALGVAVGWVVISEVGSRIIFEVIGATRPERWFLSTYVSAWLSNGVRLWDESPCQDASKACIPIEWSISMQRAALVGTVLLLTVAGTALYAFRRRDVT